MAKNIKIAGASFSNVPSLRIPLADGTGYAEFIDKDDAGGGAKNVQVYTGFNSVSSTSYTATNTKLTVSKTGKYTVSWVGIRNSTSGTSGSQLYINGSAYGSANTSFSSYAQTVTLSNVSLSAGQEIVVRARARSTSYTMQVGHLIIEEV